MNLRMPFSTTPIGWVDLVSIEGRRASVRNKGDLMERSADGGFCSEWSFYLVFASCLVFASLMFAGRAAAEPDSSVRPASSRLPAYDAAPLYDGIEVHRVYVPSFDGTRLAVTVHVPNRNGAAAEEKLPVVVQQANAAPQPESDAVIRYFTQHGYVWVSQSRRGTGASFGVQTGFVNELDARDAKATIEWAGTQEFSTGKVVTFGCSNEGAWQYLAMKFRPRYWVAASIQCASPALFDHAISSNGISFVPLLDRPYAGECAARTGALPSPFRPFTEPVQVDEDKDGSLLAAARVQHQCNADFVGQYWRNMPRDGYNAFAQNWPGIDDTPIMSARNVAQSEVAILQIGGWFDAAVAGQFEGHRLWGGRVVMLPRGHGNGPLGFANDDVDVNTESLRWFDHFAKGVANGAGPGVLYYTINAPNGQEWRQQTDWPPRASSDTFYLTASGLTTARPAGEGGPVVYAPRDVQWFDGRYAAMHRSWTGDMAPADAAGITHDTPPLARDTEMTGMPVAKLWISADQPDINIFAVIEDVSPDGRARYVTDGRLRASWRKLDQPPWGGSSWNWHRGYAADITPLTLGKPEKLVFDFYPISYVFKQGHRLRISIATSLGEAHHAPPLANGRAATLTLLRDKAHPSAIIVPIANAGL